MKKFGLIISILSHLVIYGQKDTLKVNGMLNLQAMVQSGNLNQFGGNAIGQLTMENSKFKLSLNSSYNYVNVEGMNVINDNWSFALGEWKPNKRVSPIVMSYLGFAKSFGMEVSAVNGIGANIKLFRKSPVDFLTFNLIGGYSDFRYTESQNYQGPVMNTYIAASKKWGNKIISMWELHAYQQIGEKEMHGAQNMIRLLFPVTSLLKISFSNQIVFNQLVPVGRSRWNTMTLFGVMYGR